VQSLAIALATVGGVGYAPIASGTFGSLVALPLLPALAALRGRTPVGYGLAVVAIAAASIWAAGRAERALGGHDHSAIVIDEVAGMVMAGMFLPGTWGAAVLAFFCFRVLDVVKPWPASVFDRRIEGGIGVVGDDLVAGIYAGLVGWLLMKLV